MTAEIAVYNKSAVSLAADSAVTISGGGSEKIYNGAEKLFALTKHHPVGLMVYGSGDVCSAPWELVIKAYRKQLKERSFPTLEEYSSDFFSFLENAHNVIPTAMRDKQIYSFLAESVFSSLIESFGAEKNVENPNYWVHPFDQNQFFIDLKEYCELLLEKLSDAEFLDDFDGDNLDAASTFCLDLTEHIIRDKIGVHTNIPLPDSLISVMNSVFAAMLCKKSDIGNISGIVIAGYGDNDFYPKVLSYDVCGFFDGKVRKSINIDKCTKDGESGVTPFAQEDEVSAFMQGCSKNLINQLHSQYNESIADLLDGIDSIIESKLSSEPEKEDFRIKVIEVAQNALSNTGHKIQYFMQENYVRKVVNMVEYLPKQDLAYMAESLVNLTAFKRKVSDDSETVGGPIDVAVITKADGFIWVKRKHYFDKELNHHFFVRQ